MTKEQRRRAYTNAVHVSGLGAGGPVAFGPDMIEFVEASPRYTISKKIDAGVGGQQVLGAIPAGVFVTAAWSHIDLTSGTLDLHLTDPAGFDADITLVSAADLTAAADLAITPALAPLEKPLVLIANVTDGTAGEVAAVSIEIGVTTPDWH